MSWEPSDDAIAIAAATLTQVLMASPIVAGSFILHDLDEAASVVGLLYDHAVKIVQAGPSDDAPA